MLLNIGVLGVIFIIVCLASIGGFALVYDSEGSFWQLFFGILIAVSVNGLAVCFVAAIILLIIGG